MKQSISCRTSILFTGLLFLVIALTPGCRKTGIELQRPEGKSQVSDDSPGYALYPRVFNPELSRFTDTIPLDQIVVWTKPGFSDKDFRSWVDTAIISKAGGKAVSVTKVCESCDSSLKVLSGPGVSIFIQGGLATGGKDSPEIPCSGEGNAVYFSLNFRLNHSNPRFSTANMIEPLLPATFTSQRVVKVAVLDTGLDTLTGGLKNYLFNTAGNSCVPGGAYGWNFVSNNRNYHDNDASRHGTVVTRFIIDQVNRYGKNPVRILPVKTHDANGISDLFTILCAIAYSSKQNVDIVNASWGFYEPRLENIPKYIKGDPNMPLMKEFIRSYLTKKNILLVAAAGNRDTANERAIFDLHRLVVPKIPFPTDMRSLDQVNFYPASFARYPDFPNVIAVTTVYNGTVSTDQNYSSNVVDLGVNADIRVIDANSGELLNVFNNPLYRNIEVVNGSSFATPVATGTLTANFDAISGNLYPPNKTTIWKVLGATIVRSNPSLINRIKSGNEMIKAK